MEIEKAIDCLIKNKKQLYEKLELYESKKFGFDNNEDYFLNLKRIKVLKDILYSSN